MKWPETKPALEQTGFCTGYIHREWQFPSDLIINNVSLREGQLFFAYCEKSFTKSFRKHHTASYNNPTIHLFRTKDRLPYHPTSILDIRVQKNAATLLYIILDWRQPSDPDDDNWSSLTMHFQKDKRSNNFFFSFYDFSIWILPNTCTDLIPRTSSM